MLKRRAQKITQIMACSHRFGALRVTGSLTRLDRYGDLKPTGRLGRFRVRIAPSHQRDGLK
jgi:hypothetical protein